MLIVWTSKPDQNNDIKIQNMKIKELEKLQETHEKLKTERLWLCHFCKQYIAFFISDKWRRNDTCEMLKTNNT